MELKRNRLYIMSGLPGVGKSTFLGAIPHFMIVSSDNIRELLSGVIVATKDSNLNHTRSQESNHMVLNIMRQMVEEKCRLGLTTFVDATNLNDEERKQWVEIAKKYSMEYEVLILQKDLDLIFSHNAQRDFSVNEKVLLRMQEKFQDTSKYPYQVIDMNLFPTSIKLISNTIQEKNIDVIGDIHGLYFEMIELIDKLGYSITDNQVTHPENRKLVFVGDFIDRGEYSIDTLKFIKSAVEQGHYAIVGNHEEKLISSYEKIKNNEEIFGGLSGKITLSNLLKEPKRTQESLIAFLKSLPFYYVHEHSKSLLVHADILNGNLDSLTRQEAIYGYSRKGEKINTDQQYQFLYEKDYLKYRLIRGHIPAMSTEKDVISLEGGQAFNGHLLALPINTKDWGEIVKVKSDFNYTEHTANNPLFKINELSKEKLISTKLEKGLMLCKYEKSVFFKNRWSEDPFLLKSRGLVLDYAGNIVQHPFDKIFNYLENDTGRDINDDKEVVYVEKYNGFLGNIGLNPITKQLLITTTGSFDSDFTGYVKDFITPKLNSALLGFLNKNPMTLSFEVIHPEDPHIIEYNPEEMGLVLIGARKLEYNAQSLPEAIVDEIAIELGFKRPVWKKTTFKQIKEMVKESKIEGFIIRDASCPNESPMLKFKTPYYLITKFLARMGNSKAVFMYKNKEKFKESIDEEFYDLVDYLVENISMEDFISMSKEEATPLIRNIIEELRK